MEQGGGQRGTGNISSDWCSFNLSWAPTDCGRCPMLALSSPCWHHFMCCFLVLVTDSFSWSLAISPWGLVLTTCLLHKLSSYLPGGPLSVTTWAGYRLLHTLGYMLTRVSPVAGSISHPHCLSGQFVFLRELSTLPSLNSKGPLCFFTI